MDESEHDARNPGQRLHEQVVELETLIMHLQRTVSDLDQVVLAQQKQIEALKRTTNRLRAEHDALASAAQEVRNPEEEKPPHY